MSSCKFCTNKYKNLVQSAYLTYDKGSGNIYLSIGQGGKYMTKVIYKNGHYEVYKNGFFQCSADTRHEAEQDREEAEKIENRNLILKRRFEI